MDQDQIARPAVARPSLVGGEPTEELPAELAPQGPFGTYHAKSCNRGFNAQPALWLAYRPRTVYRGLAPYRLRRPSGGADFWRTGDAYVAVSLRWATMRWPVGMSPSPLGQTSHRVETFIPGEVLRVSSVLQSGIRNCAIPRFARFWSAVGAACRHNACAHPLSWVRRRTGIGRSGSLPRNPGRHFFFAKCG